MGDGIGILEKKHMIAILLYLLERGSATRMDIYNDIANNDHMPDKFAILEGCGLITQTVRIPGRAIVLSLTEEGEEAARALCQVDRIIRAGEGTSDAKRFPQFPDRD